MTLWLPGREASRRVAMVLCTSVGLYRWPAVHEDIATSGCVGALLRERQGPRARSETLNEVVQFWPVSLKRVHSNCLESQSEWPATFWVPEHRSHFHSGAVYESYRTNPR